MSQCNFGNTYMDELNNNYKGDDTLYVKFIGIKNKYIIFLLSKAIIKLASFRYIFHFVNGFKYSFNRISSRNHVQAFHYVSQIIQTGIDVLVEP